MLDNIEKIIDELSQTRNHNVLISNLKTLSEFVSLHHNCNDTKYLYLSYNLTHIIQSRDRIHILNQGKNTKTKYYYNYYFLAKMQKNL